ncbi:MAG: ATP-binding protein [Rhizobiaceae bacterium]
MGDVVRADAAPAEGRAVPLARGLSAKLLLLTAGFVIVAELLIFLPSIAGYRLRWLEERLGTAAAVSVVLLESDEPLSLSREAQDEVLKAIGAQAIAVRDAGVSTLLAVSEMPPEVDEHVDLDATGWTMAMTDALDTIVFGGDRILRVFGRVGDSTKEYELLMPDRKLRTAMLVYARNIALLGLLIALITAAPVFWAINRVIIRPVRGMTRSMLSFARAPDDRARIVVPSDRVDEIGIAERELAEMQTTLQKMLAEQKHLADLGLAVSKINHDMRNLLSSVQLMSDRLRSVKDPAVQAFAPKLVRALDRAVSYSEGVLAYGRTQEAAPVRRRIRLRQLVDDVHGLLGIDPDSGIEFLNDVEAGFEIDADPEQLFRVLTNLCRNAVQAMSGDPDGALVRRLTVGAERNGSVCRILVTDTGPGLPPKALDNLFVAFRGSARIGGTGLGLAIAQELARAHGGAVELLETRGGHTVFAITIPDQPVRLEDARVLRRGA